MVAEAPALIIFSKIFLVAAENSTSVLTYVIFPLVRTRPIFLPGKFPTWIVCCQRGLEGRSSVSLGPTPSTLCLWINCQHDGTGQCLPQFTPCATLCCGGINVFAQSPPSDHNLYVFPPFVLIAPLLKCNLEQDFHSAFTIIIPDLRPSGGRIYSRLLSITFFWEEKTGMAFCCSPLKSVSIGPPENFNGIYGLSAVFVKAHLISSLGYASVEVRPPLLSLPVSQRFRRKLLSGMRNINRTPTCCYNDCSRG